MASAELIPAAYFEDVPSLTDSERDAVKQFLEDGNTRIDLVVPRTIDPERLWDGLSGTCKIHQGAASVGSKIKPLIGRLLVVLSDYPELVTNAGYKNYEDFMARGLKERFGISRSEGYAYRKVAERFPSLTIEDYREIGPSKLHALAALTQEGENDCKQLVAKAREGEVTRKQLVGYAAEIQHRSRDEIDLTTIVLTVTKDTAQRWREFVKSNEVKAYIAARSGSSATEELAFIHMMDEAETEWIAQGKALLDYKSPALED